MKAKVYIETTVVSYLVALPTRDIIQMAHQEITRKWWSVVTDSTSMCLEPSSPKRAEATPTRRPGGWRRSVEFGAWLAAAGWSLWLEPWSNMARCLSRRGWTQRTWGSPRRMAWNTC